MHSLRHKIAQLLIVGFQGESLASAPELVKCIAEDGLGGVILFDKDLSKGRDKKNLTRLSQIKQLNQSLQREARASDAMAGMPLLISVDFEGGMVDRFSNVPGSHRSLSPLKQADLSYLEFVHEQMSMAEQLKTLGFNLNFAPVLDLALNQDAGILGRLERCYSDNPERVAQCAAMMVKTYRKYKLMTCAKHFPGHGSAEGDSHLGFVDVSNTFDPAELLPYEMLIRQGNIPEMIMTAHVINRKLDPLGTPATLSKPILTGLLRRRLGYQGVIVSDDMQMKAIASHFSLDDALAQSLHAGIDMFIFGNQLGQHEPRELITRIERLVRKNKVDALLIENAWKRVAQLKKFTR